MEDIQALFNSTSGVIAAVAAAATVLLQILRHLSRTWEWSDKHFIRKRLVRLKAIRSSAPKHTELSQFLDAAIELEVFRIASGIDTNQIKMKYLLELSQSGRMSRDQLYSTSKYLYLKPGEAVPKLEITAADHVGAWISGIAAFSMWLLATLLLVNFAVNGELLTWLIGGAFFAVGIVAGRLLATDLIDYLIVKRVNKHLELTTKSSS